MATLINGETPATTHETLAGRAQVEAVQTVPPSQITASRKLRRVSPLGGSVAGGCVHVVLCYNKADEGGDCGSIHAGWIKASLAEALSEQPLLAGRLRRLPDGEKGGDFVVVSNDAGVRLVEARIGLTMAEFVRSRSAESESELVFWNWKEFDDCDPQYSPLFYVQVTKFECGGYSFGISCTILLADLLLNEKFLKKWAEFHNNFLSKNGVPEKPLFYLPNLKKEASTPEIGNIFSSNPTKDSGRTMIFDVGSVDHQTDPYSDEFNALAMLCVEEAKSKFGATKMAPISTTMCFGSGPTDMVKIDNFSKHELIARKPNVGLESRINCANWDGFGTNELEFRRGNRPVRASHWIGSVSNELVLGIPVNHGLKMIVSVPNN